MLVDESMVIGDIDVAYTEGGKGEDVVLVHGLAEDQHSFSVTQETLAGFHTLAYAFRGHGGTSIGNAKGSLEQLGEDLIALLETLEGPARCVGYSLGGTIVLWAAASRPDLISHVVVAGSSTVVGRSAVEFFKERIALIESNRTAFAMALREDTKAQITRQDADVDAVTERRLDAVGDGDGYINAARAMIAVNGKPLTPMLGKIKCPVDVIGGDRDVFCPRKAADIIMSGLSNGHYHEIADSGHLMSVDQPLVYANQIRDILTRRTT